MPKNEDFPMRQIPRNEPRTILIPSESAMEISIHNDCANTLKSFIPPVNQISECPRCRFDIRPYGGGFECISIICMWKGAFGYNYTSPEFHLIERVGRGDHQNDHLNGTALLQDQRIQVCWPDGTRTYVKVTISDSMFPNTGYSAYYSTSMSGQPCLVPLTGLKARVV